MTDRPQTTRQIAEVYTFTNGMCRAFDEKGHQMPEFDGRTSECLPRIREVFDGPVKGPLEWREPTGEPR